MSYSKNNWEERVGITKQGGFKVLPLSGLIIRKDSDIENFKFESDSHKSIRIMGDFIIEQNGSQISSDELTEEVEFFYNELILGKSILEVKYDQKMNLIISISTEPELHIKVDVTNHEYPSEKWEYSCKEGYISN